MKRSLTRFLAALCLIGAPASLLAANSQPLEKPNAVDFGSRVSEDLLNWTSHPFPASVRPLMTSDDGTYCAAPVATQGGWLYFINMIPHKADLHASIMRTRDPLSGVWERCGQIKKVKDPALCFDDGRAPVYEHPSFTDAGPDKGQKKAAPGAASQ